MGCYFQPGEGVCAIIEHRGYGHPRPVITDNEGNFIMQSTKGEEEEFFIWNDISGILLRVKGRGLNLPKVVRYLGRSLLSFDVECVGST